MSPNPTSGLAHALRSVLPCVLSNDNILICSSAKRNLLAYISEQPKSNLGVSGEACSRIHTSRNESPLYFETALQVLGTWCNVFFQGQGHFFCILHAHIQTAKSALPLAQIKWLLLLRTKINI